MPRRFLSAGRSTVEVFTSPHATADLDPEPALIALVESAKSSILVGSYSFTLAPLAEALVYQHASGIPVRIAADAVEYTAASQYPVLQAAGIDIHTRGTQYDLQHLKVIVVDSEYVA